MISVFQTYVVVVVNLEDLALPFPSCLRLQSSQSVKNYPLKKCRLGVSIHRQFVVRTPDLNNWDRWAQSD